MGERGPIKRAKPGAPVARKRKRSKPVVPAPYAHPPKPPKPPADLGRAGKVSWAALWAAPQVMNGDATTIGQLCRLEDQAAALRVELEKDGSILRQPIVSSKGEIVGEQHVPHPSLRELRRIGVEAIALCKELGLSPQARARLGLTVIDVETKADALDKLRTRRAARLGLPAPIPGEDRVV
jgi:P27 family predicted phage terminase small subunit